MGYRKITVNDTVHEYVVGRDVVKFRGGPIVPHKDIGHRVSDIVPARYIVTPGTIAEYLITGKVEPITLVEIEVPCGNSERYWITGDTVSKFIPWDEAKSRASQEDRLGY